MEKLTVEQQDRICWLIGDWYLHIKNNLVNYEQKTLKLGYAKEILKAMICEDLSIDEVQNKINNIFNQ